MNALLQIEGGYNHLDPLRDFFETAARQTRPDPELAPYCAEALSMAVGLCVQYDQAPQVSMDSGWAQFRFRVADVRYRASSGAEGLVTLQAEVPVYRYRGLLVPALSEASADISARAPHDDSLQSVYFLQRAGIYRDSDTAPYVGTRADINFFMGVIDKIRAVALPKQSPDPNEAELRALIANTAGPGHSVHRLVETTPSL